MKILGISLTIILSLAVLVGVPLAYPQVQVSFNDSPLSISLGLNEVQADTITIVEPPNRHYYLSQWTIEKETGGYIPIIGTYTNTFGVIDLRPDSTKVDGYCIGYADGELITGVDGVTYLCDTVKETNKDVQNTIRQITNINVIGSSATLADYLFKYLSVDDPDKCKPMKPSSDGKYRIYIGQQIWGDPKPKYKHNTLTDDFNRADLGSDWTDVDAGGGWSIYSSTLLENDGDGTWTNTLRYDAATVSSEDHYSQLDYTYAGGTGTFVCPAVRMDASANTYYFAFTRARDSLRRIQKMVAGASSTLAEDENGSAPPHEVRLEVDGSSLTFYEDDVGDLGVSDTSITGNTHVGIAGYNLARGDNWEADDLVPASEPSISSNVSSEDLGTQKMLSTVYAKGSAPNNPVEDTDCTFALTNDGAATCNVTASMSDITGNITIAAVSGTPSTNEFRMTIYKAGDDPGNDGIVLGNDAVSFLEGMTASNVTNWDFKMELGEWDNAPGYTYGQHSGTLQLTAIAP